MMAELQFQEPHSEHSGSLSHGHVLLGHLNITALLLLLLVTSVLFQLLQVKMAAVKNGYYTCLFSMAYLET